VARHEVLVDDGRPATRGRWGVIPGRPSRVYYAPTVDGYERDPERACVRSGQEVLGSLAMVTKRLAINDLRGACATDVPPEPVLKRVGHDRLAHVRRLEIAGRVVWAVRSSFLYASDLMVLDERGHLVRARAVVAEARHAMGL